MRYPAVQMLKIGKFKCLQDSKILILFRWGPLMGPGRAFDSSKFFIFCGNALGSPYGSASPVTINPDTEETYGPEFPLVTIRDDVKYGSLRVELRTKLVFIKLSWTI